MRLTLRLMLILLAIIVYCEFGLKAVIAFIVGAFAVRIFHKLF